MMIIDKLAQSPSPSKGLLSPRRSPRHAVEILVDIPSVIEKPKTLTKTFVKQKKSTAEEVETTAKKAKTIVPAAKEEPHKYDFCLFIDIIESATYDANFDDLGTLGLPEDVTKLVAKSFVKLKEITKELNEVVKHKKILEQIQREAKSEYESKGLDKDIMAAPRLSVSYGKTRLTGTAECKCKYLSHVIEEMKTWGGELKLPEEELPKKNVRR